MHDQNIDQANLLNLTCLWEQMGASKKSCGSLLELHISDSWPYRCWANNQMKTEALIAIMQVMQELPADYITPLWLLSHESVENKARGFFEQGFELAFEQTAMYLDVRQYTGKTSIEIDLVTIISSWGIKTWTEVAARSFKYEIDPAVIAKINQHPDLKLLLALVDGEPAATALIFLQKNMAGIHQMGVLPEYRGQGLARQLMHYVIEYCQQLRIRYITLQASSAGESLYSKLGFHNQFKIYNFQQGK